MPKLYISRTRFRWKTEPWKEPKNIRALWLYCVKGILSFELEIDPSINLPQNKGSPAPASKHKDENNFIRVKDPKIISTVGQKVKEFSIQGAIGQGVWLGNIELPLDNEFATVPLMSTLEDWQEWQQYLHTDLPSL